MLFLQKYRRIRLTGLLLVLATLLSSCGVADFYKRAAPWHRLNELRSLSILSQNDANYDTPVLMDLIFIFNEPIYQLISPLSVEDWFTNKRASLPGLYPEDLKIITLEIVPFTNIDEVELPDRHKKALNIMVFTRYLDFNDMHKAEIGDYENVRLILNKDGIEVQSIDS